MGDFKDHKSAITHKSFMGFHPNLDCVLLIVAVALTRFIFKSHYLYDIDSVNFALALNRFDPSVHQPHPPGYFLYVCLGRLANAIFHDANTALVAVSIAASCGTVAMIYVLTSNWFGRRAAAFAGLTFLFSPLAWFHGTVALTYIVEGFFSALIGYLCWRVYSGTAGLLLPAAVCLGVAAGFRPSSVLFLGPLWLLSLRSVTRRNAVAGAGAFIITVLVWGIPMIRESGGMEVYVSSLLSLWQTVPSKQTVFNSSLATSVARLFTIIGISVLCFGGAVTLPFHALRRTSLVERRKKTFTLVWITPASLFFVFVFLKFVNSGYLLLLSPPAYAWLGLWAADWYGDGRFQKTWNAALAGVAAAANVAIFLWAPVYCSYSEVRRFEGELESILKLLPRVASPAQALIVGFDSHFLGYRHAGYYLPEYLTVQFPEVRLASGIRVFVMQHRDTRLARKLSDGPYTSFVLFPLPGGDAEYREYVQQVRARFPSGHLRTAMVGGREFIIGTRTDLPLLFPNTA